MKSYNELIKTETFWVTKIQNDLYNIIREYMDERGITQTKLAEELGVSKGYISQVLNGNFNHKLDKLVSLALAVGKVPNLTFEDIDTYANEQQNPSQALTSNRSETSQVADKGTGYGKDPSS